MNKIKLFAAALAGILALPITIGIAQDKKAEEKTEEAAPVVRTPSPKGAKVYLQGIKDGKEVTKEFVVRFGLKGMGIAPAGIPFPDSGHHHLLINTELKDFNAPIPSDDTHRHFGKGQTEAVLTLEPGEHTLQLVLGDHMHVPHDPPVVSKKVTITVLAE